MTRYLRRLVALCLLFSLVISPVSQAATDIEIETAIQNGVAWLAGAQNADGSWGTSDQTAQTCFALTKLQHRAYELGFPSPFDPAYDYDGEVTAGWTYVFNAARTMQQTPLAVQTHGDPDANGNGYGVYFTTSPGHDVYTTSVCLMALYASGTQSRTNEGQLDFDAAGGPDTYLELAQDAVDWLAWAQIDGGLGLGSWDYFAMDNADDAFDGSIGGYAGLGLGLAEAFGATIPQWVRDQMVVAIDNNQCTTPGPNFGGSSYTSPCSWVNLYKTGHLIYHMGFVGIPQSDQRFVDAMAYIENHWQDNNADPGWGYNYANPDYQVMFSLMKGFVANGITLLDTDGDGMSDNDWFNQEPPASPAEDFASVIVAEQNADGSWSGCYWGGSELCTSWALITLERDIPVVEPAKATPVPTFSQLTAFLAILMLGGVGLWVLRRKA